MTVITTSLIATLEQEIASAREDLLERVDRLDALRDLQLRASYHRDQYGSEPSIDDLLKAADELEAAAIRGPVRLHNATGSNGIPHSPGNQYFGPSGPESMRCRFVRQGSRVDSGLPRA
jgi:hypothetical protein